MEIVHLSAAPDEQDKVGNGKGVGGRRCRPIPPFHAHRFAAIGVSMNQYTDQKGKSQVPYLVELAYENTRCSIQKTGYLGCRARGRMMTGRFQDFSTNSKPKNNPGKHSAGR